MYKFIVAFESAPFYGDTLSEPEEGSSAPLSGVRVAGDVEGQLGDCFLWLFTYSDGQWYLSGSIEPLQDGSFELDSGQLGVKEEKGKTFSLRIVAVDEAGSEKIANKKPNSDGDVSFPSRPGQLMVQRQVKRI